MASTLWKFITILTSFNYSVNTSNLLISPHNPNSIQLHQIDASLPENEDISSPPERYSDPNDAIVQIKFPPARFRRGKGEVNLVEIIHLQGHSCRDLGPIRVTDNNLIISGNIYPNAGKFCRHVVVATSRAHVRSAWRRGGGEDIARAGKIPILGLIANITLRPRRPNFDLRHTYKRSLGDVIRENEANPFRRDGAEVNRPNIVGYADRGG